MFRHTDQKRICHLLFLSTGFPRSGSSLLMKYSDDYDGVRLLNEISRIRKLVKHSASDFVLNNGKHQWIIRDVLQRKPELANETNAQTWFSIFVPFRCFPDISLGFVTDEDASVHLSGRLM